LNAIDHTPAGGQVTLRARQVGGQAQLSVEDTGPGMDRARLVAVDRPFASDRPGGTGLGLAIARQAIEQHGGVLVLDSAPGRGTVARVSLPIGDGALAGEVA
jgi:signal transduction histidine kinase